jgi:prevent-host-death family protein
MVMKPVGIAELKSRLSEYVRAVRDGATVTVLDRNTPVAKIVPIQPPGLRVRKPAPGSLPLKRLLLPPPLDLKLDVMELLSEERQDR